VRGLVGGGIGPARILGVGESHVTHAQRVIDAEDAQGIVDGMAALDADQRSDPAFFVNANDVVSRTRHLEDIRVAGDHAVNIKCRKPAWPA